MASPRLLAILAHPDDEAFGIGGTLAMYARRGVGVHVCTVTDGAAGAVDGRARRNDVALPLKEVRLQELQCACQLLGATLHRLDYRDSGMAGTADNQHPDSLFQADLDVVAQRLARVIDDVVPQVVITHDPSGGYFHPDHMKVNRAVIRAWDHYGDDGTARSVAWQPQRLYYTVVPRSALKWLIFVLRVARQDPQSFGNNQDIDLTRVGVPDAEINVRLDIRCCIEVKEQASACHSSQGGARSLRVVPSFLRRRFMRYEYYVQARPPTSQRYSDLFEGLGFDM
jgi:LmbE family N-acetylglucosaminyl deacetylase